MAYLRFWFGDLRSHGHTETSTDKGALCDQRHLLLVLLCMTSVVNAML